MSIKVNLPTIPIVESISAFDYLLVGSTASAPGTARLVQIATIGAALGVVVGSTPGAVISGDDGHYYLLTGVVVDGQITIQAVLIS